MPAPGSLWRVAPVSEGGYSRTSGARITPCARLWRLCWLFNGMSMRQKLDWMDVLNEQTHWHTRADFRLWFSEQIGRPASLLDGTIDGFDEAIGFMRRQVANLHFEESVDLLWLDTQLKTISLGLLHHQGAQEGADSRLPRFRSRVKGMIDSDLLRAVKDTLLIQFAEFIGDALDGTSSRTVMRCEGLHRELPGSIPEAASFNAETEQRWRDELPVIKRASASGIDLHRCVNLYVAAPKTKFCSDTCRFATFQTAKQIEQPTYTADKQRRYRRRAEKQAEST